MPKPAYREPSAASEKKVGGHGSGRGPVSKVRSNTTLIFGLKKATWKRLGFILIALYIGWSQARMADQDRIIALQQNLIKAQSGTTVDPSNFPWTLTQKMNPNMMDVSVQN